MIDLLVSLTILVFILSWLLPILAILIKLDSRGPVFFRQKRTGCEAKTFDCFKLRTMSVNKNSDDLQAALNDPRITRMGKFLRVSNLDELPQFINVLLGHMSIVGPRPERRYYIQQIVQEAPYYCLLYKIRPGLTSWGPIRIGYSDSIEKMIERLNYDIIYLESMSLITDLKILLLTLEIIFKGKGV